MVPDAASGARRGYHPLMGNGELTADGIAADGEGRARLRAVVISLAVSVVLLARQVPGVSPHRLHRHPVRRARVHRQRGGRGIRASAALIFAGRPADRNHPYGHGKMEFLSAAFEGGLIAFAAVLIVYEVVSAPASAASRLRVARPGRGHRAGRGAREPALGYYLIRAGRKLRLAGPVADGRHVLADFYTSAGIVAGLLLVRITGIALARSGGGRGGGAQPDVDRGAPDSPGGRGAPRRGGPGLLDRLLNVLRPTWARA